MPELNAVMDGWDAWQQLVVAGNGRRLARGSQSSSAAVGGRSDSGGSSSIPAGVGGAKDRLAVRITRELLPAAAVAALARGRALQDGWFSLLFLAVGANELYKAVAGVV